MKLLIVALPLALTAACAPVGGADETPRPVGAGECDAGSLTDLVGKPGTSELAADALQRSGATRMRWLQPGSVVTMDYRTDRLNISLDEKNVATGFKCG